MGGLVAVNTNRAEDQARPTDGGGPASAGQGRGNQLGAATGDTDLRSEPVTPLAGSGHRWRVRVHWGIVFAVVASVILWLAIRSVVGLVF